MRTVARICLICLLLMTAHRLPAPIVEEEKPTPAPEQSEAPKQKHSAKSKTTLEEEAVVKTERRAKPAPPPAMQGPSRFAGTWKGKINQGVLGHVQTTFVVDPTATSIELSHNLGGGKRPLTANGNTISRKTGVVGEVAWTLSPNSDGQTAQITMKGLLLNDTTTFRRGLPAERH